MTEKQQLQLQALPAANVPRAIAAFFDARFSSHDGLFKPSHHLLGTDGNPKVGNLIFFEFTESLPSEAEVVRMLDAHDRTFFSAPRNLISMHRTPRWLGAVGFYTFPEEDLPQHTLVLAHSVGAVTTVADSIAEVYNKQRAAWKSSPFASDDRFSPVHELYAQHSRISNDRFALFVSDDAVFA